MSSRLRLNAPPSVNHMYVNAGHGRRMLTAEAREWAQAAAVEAWNWRRQTGWALPDPAWWVYVDMWIWWPDTRKRDPTNLLKILLDACNGILWADDDQVLVRQHGYWVRPSPTGVGRIELALQAQQPDPDPLGPLPALSAPGVPLGRRPRRRPMQVAKGGTAR